jgi:hypothetical protein
LCCSTLGILSIERLLSLNAHHEMMWDSSSRFSFNLALFCLQLLYYAVGLALFWRNRANESIQCRRPHLVILLSLWYVATALSLIFQEVINNYEPNNPEDYSYRFPCAVTDLLSCCSIGASIVSSTRQQIIYVQFNFNLRQQAKYRKFLNPRFISLTLSAALLISLALFGALLGTGRSYYRDLTLSPHCDLWEFTPLWLGMMAFSVFLMASRVKQLSTVKDRFNVGPECIIIMLCTTFVCSVFAVINFLFYYLNPAMRNTIDTEYLPMLYFWVLISNTILWVYFYGPVLHIYAENRKAKHQIQLKLVQSSFTASPAAESQGNLLHNLQLDSTSQLRGEKPRQHSKQSAGATGGGQIDPRSAAHINEIVLLAYILDDEELVKLFEIHAQRSLCGEIVQFYRKCHESLVKSQQFHRLVNQTQASNENSPIITIYDNNSTNNNNSNHDNSWTLNISEDYSAWFAECLELYSSYIIEGSSFELNLPATLRGQFRQFLHHYHSNLLQHQEGGIARVSQETSLRESPEKGRKSPPISRENTLQLPGPGAEEAKSPGFKKFLAGKRTSLSFSGAGADITANTLKSLRSLGQTGSFLVQNSLAADYTALNNLLLEALNECVNLIRGNLLRTFLGSSANLALINKRIEISPLPSLEEPKPSQKYFPLLSRYQATPNTKKYGDFQHRRRVSTAFVTESTRQMGSESKNRTNLVPQSECQTSKLMTLSKNSDEFGTATAALISITQKQAEMTLPNQIPG